MPALLPQELLNYAACDCVLSPGDTMRLALLDQISQTIGGGGGESFNILTEGGDFLTAENGDQLITE